MIMILSNLCFFMLRIGQWIIARLQFSELQKNLLTFLTLSIVIGGFAVHYYSNSLRSSLLNRNQLFVVSEKETINQANIFAKEVSWSLCSFINDKQAILIQICLMNLYSVDKLFCCLLNSMQHISNIQVLRLLCSSGSTRKSFRRMMKELNEWKSALKSY